MYSYLIPLFLNRKPQALEVKSFAVVALSSGSNLHDYLEVTIEYSRSVVAAVACVDVHFFRGYAVAQPYVHKFYELRHAGGTSFINTFTIPKDFFVKDFNLVSCKLT